MKSKDDILIESIVKYNNLKTLRAKAAWFDKIVPRLPDFMAWCMDDACPKCDDLMQLFLAVTKAADDLK